MGLMDKVKQQAGQALVKAQQGVSQGQAKLDQVQAKRQADVLLRDLGAAYYAWQRTDGPKDAVDSAIRLVDEHVAAHGPVDGPGARTSSDGGDAASGGGEAVGNGGDANFGIEDV
jgi:hypothetical protein